MGIQVKVNKINDLAGMRKTNKAALTHCPCKVARPFFVHKSIGEVCISAKKPHFLRVCVLA